MATEIKIKGFSLLYDDDSDVWAPKRPGTPDEIVDLANDMTPPHYVPGPATPNPGAYRASYLKTHFKAVIISVNADDEPAGIDGLVY